MTQRKEQIRELQQKTFDVLIIGGGATGAGIALDAATRGLSVALLEQEDFAFGTSSRSTKLIHGGLRYLKQLEFALVAQVGRERSIVHALAPHLVIPEKMIMPLVEKGTYGTLSTSMGLKVYDLLAGVREEDRRVMLSKEEALVKEPLLDESNLLGAGYYAEYRTDDARLTIELIKTAIKHKAICVNYCQVRSFLYENNQIIGVRSYDSINSNEIVTRASYVINAAGPWVDKVRLMGDAMNEKKLHLTKGIHIVVPHFKLPVKQSIYFDVPDGRMIFAIPRGNVTYVGTTDISYYGNKSQVYAEQKEVEYLVDALNAIFPEVDMSQKDIVSTWAGLRPLIHEDGKSPSELSRKNEIFEAENGLITIAGGKLTGYRKMAEKVVDLISKKMRKNDNRKIKPCQTEHVPLLGNAFDDFTDVKRYIERVSRVLNKIDDHVLISEYLVTSYGNQTEEILSHAKQNYDTIDIRSLVLSELEFCLNCELVQSSTDFLLRRTGRIFFNIDEANKFKVDVSEYIGDYFDWTKDKRKGDLQNVNKELESVINFKH